MPTFLQTAVNKIPLLRRRASVDIGETSPCEYGNLRLGDDTWARLGRIHTLFSELAEWSPKKKMMRRGAKSAAGMVLGLDYNRSHSPELNYIEMMSRLMCLDHVSGSLGVSIRLTKVGQALPGLAGRLPWRMDVAGPGELWPGRAQPVTCHASRVAKFDPPKTFC